MLVRGSTKLSVLLLCFQAKLRDLR
jgi:hypothetical protein